MKFLTLNNYVSEMPYLVDSIGDIYGGAYRIPKGSMFYTTVLLDKNISILDTNEAIAYLTSPEGHKAVTRQFRRKYYRPLKKWFKNRKIKNNKLFFFMLTHMSIYDNYLRDMHETALDPQEVIKFFKANEMY